VKTFILDASVGAKWFLPPAAEPLAQQAQHLLENYTKGQVRLMVPDLFWSELGNVFWKSSLRGRLSKDQAANSITQARQLGLLVLPTIDLVSQAFKIAVTSGRTVYDSIYIAAAVSENTELLTADERLVNATGARFPVRWLGAPGIV